MKSFFTVRHFFLGAALGGIVLLSACSKPSSGDEYLRLMNVGKALYEQGDAARAVESFQRAVTLAPTQTDARLNLANAHLRAGQAEQAVEQSREVLKLEPNSAAAHYLAGCGLLRLSRFTEAIQELQMAKDIDQTINAVSFQLGRAFLGDNKLEEAALQFAEVTQFETNHPSASYNLSQVLIRLGRNDEAARALENHQRILAGRGNPPSDASTFESCIYTEIRTPFVLEQPRVAGIPVRFVDATREFFGEDAEQWRGPVAVLDVNHRGTNDLFLREGDAAFRLLLNQGGKFEPAGPPLPASGGGWAKALVGDLNNDRIDDVVMLGENGTQAFRFATNGAVMDATVFANLADKPAIDGALVDLDFTGKLDLLLVPPASNAVRVLRNLGGMYFMEITATSGVPAMVSAPRRVAVEDWNNDDVSDAVVLREGQPPLLLIKERGGLLTVSNTPAGWPVARAVASGDLNNDLRPDFVFATADGFHCVFNGLTNTTTVTAPGFGITHLELVDFDNDGWLDVLGVGHGVRLWRNAGLSGFREVTRDVGLDAVPAGAVESVALADFDNDCDTDLLIVSAGGGLRLFRNEGGNKNRQLKLQLTGTRSNTSALGVKVEVTARSWRTLRTVQKLPFEIGVGAVDKLDALTVRWFDLAWHQPEVDVVRCDPFPMVELMIPTGSCPYLYAWDGTKFRFITDLLSAAPLGLPVAEGRYIEADPDEYVWLGGEDAIQPKDGYYTLQITEELREVLYLDEARLVVVDHPPGTAVYPTDQLLPGGPFPPSELLTLRLPQRLLRAERDDGLDVTANLREVDARFVSPARLRVPQLRGLAEPHQVTMDFGPLDTARPLVLGLTGWLRFGGGMANIAASHDPALPFPFPVLQVETADGRWRNVDTVIGAPIGRTKRYLVDLSGKLPEGSRRLRLSTAFEIHWDQAVLFEKDTEAATRTTALVPDTADLHWRGFSDFMDLPWDQPLTPDYDRVRSRPHWQITPSGWCTRYGDVLELVTARDDALVLINGGDELTLRFSADRLPPKPEGFARDFFLYSVGWDKDSDFHVKTGTTVGPLPFHGMDYQRYGEETRAETEADRVMQRYNTRWVGPMTFSRKTR